MKYFYGLVFIFASLVIPKLVFAEEVVFWQPYSGSANLVTLGTENIAFELSTSTDVNLCGLSFTVWKPGGFVEADFPDYFKVKLIQSINGSITSSNNTSFDLATYNYADVDVAYPGVEKVIDLSFCIPLFFGSSPSSTYYIAFDTEKARSEYVTSWRFFGTKTSSDPTTGGMIDSWCLDDTVPTAQVWVNCRDTPFNLTDGSPVIGFVTSTGDLLQGLELNLLGSGFIESNTSTGAGWFSTCSEIDKDFGWWSPLLRMFMYLFCPDIETVNAFTALKDNANDRVPFGYVNKLYDEVGNYSTGTSEFILNFKIKADLATATLNVTESYEEVPEDVRLWFRNTMVWIAWIAFFIYFVFRGVYLFNKPSN